MEWLRRINKRGTKWNIRQTREVPGGLAVKDLASSLLWLRLLLKLGFNPWPENHMPWMQPKEKKKKDKIRKGVHAKRKSPRDKKENE